MALLGIVIWYCENEDAFCEKHVLFLSENHVFHMKIRPHNRVLIVAVNSLFWWCDAKMNISAVPHIPALSFWNELRAVWNVWCRNEVCRMGAERLQVQS